MIGSLFCLILGYGLTKIGADESLSINIQGGGEIDGYHYDDDVYKSGRTSKIYTLNDTKVVKVFSDKMSKDKIECEININTYLSSISSNIVNVLSTLVTNDNKQMCVVLERCGERLDEYLSKNPNRFNMYIDKLYNILKSINSQCNFLHNDLHALNVLTTFSEPYDIKIIDFGNSYLDGVACKDKYLPTSMRHDRNHIVDIVKYLCSCLQTRNLTRLSLKYLNSHFQYSKNLQKFHPELIKKLEKFGKKTTDDNIVSLYSKRYRNKKEQELLTVIRRSSCYMYYNDNIILEHKMIH